MEIRVNVLLNKEAELTDSIYGIIQYVKEQSYKQKQLEKYKAFQNQKVKHFVETGKILPPKTSVEDSDNESGLATFEDIANFFPYLKNLEEQHLKP